MPSGLLQHLKVTLRLYARNKMALFYSYLFPIIFFVAFLVLYRTETRPLYLHMGELLTVSVLGGACFGLPTSLVSERERGVWRRYRLAPISTGSLVASTLIARYVTVFSAGLIQLLLGMAIGHWVPAHPFDLFVSFTLVAVAFLGLGLVIATLADNVPAVQALGQCIFLPMLIIGGVAVKLASLPEWALHVSAFFPGRYAVESMQACVNGDGLAPMLFNLQSLLLIGVAGCIAGAKLFRWDSMKRFLSGEHKAWLGVALAAWAVVGITAEFRGGVALHGGRTINDLNVKTSAPAPTSPETAVTSGGSTAPAPQAAPTTPSVAQTEAPASAPPAASASTTPAASPESAAPETKTTETASTQVAATTSTPAAASDAEPWQAYTKKDFEVMPVRNMPADNGNVTPIAGNDEVADPASQRMLDQIAAYLPQWAPGHVKDPVQRVRNYLLFLGAVDDAQISIERFLPAVVLGQMYNEFQTEDLEKILCWIYNHPNEGDTSVLNDQLLADVGAANFDPTVVPQRAQIYAAKFNWWLLGW